MWSVTSEVTPGCPSRSAPIHDPNRSSAGVRTGRVPVRPASPANAPFADPPRAGGCVERPVHRPLEAGHRDEQRLVEHRELGAHLVERRRGDRSHLARVPQERDLLAQPAPQVGVLVGRRVGVVERVEQPPDPPLGDQERAPARLGGMGGEHGVDRRAG